MNKMSVGLAALAALSGCAGRAERPIDAMGPPRAMDWHKVATDADRRRLRSWRTAWLTALAKARAAGHGAAIDAEGALFLPDRALAHAKPPPGVYRCRIFKLGANGAAMRDFTAYPGFECRVDDEGDIASFYKTSGSQRPVGLLFDDGDARQIFLGTLMLGDESKPLNYGRDADRDMIGAVERIGPKRWRMVLPYPRFESLLDVVELVPVE